MRVRSAMLVSVLGLLVLVSLLGVQARPASAASPSFVRIIHASPFVGTADVFVDGAELLSSFAFGAVTGYASIPPGPHKVQISLVGKGIGAAALTQTLTVSPGVAYTVAAIGTQPTNLTLEVFVDNNGLVPGMTKLRTYQLSPNAGSVSVASGGNMLFSGLTYQRASGYLAVSAGAYTFNVNSSSNNATLTTSATLSANTIESIFVVGMFNGTPSSEIVTSQAAGLPNVPNTGSDPNAAPQTNAEPGQPSTSWTWLLSLVLLLLAGSGIYLRRTIIKRGSR